MQWDSIFRHIQSGLVLDTYISCYGQSVLFLRRMILLSSSPINKSHTILFWFVNQFIQFEWFLKHTINILWTSYDSKLRGRTEKRYSREPLKTPSGGKSPPSQCSEEWRKVLKWSKKKISWRLSDGLMVELLKMLAQTCVEP